MIDAILVGLGGLAGAIGRHLVGERIETDGRDTLAVNLVGSLVLGVVLTAPTNGAAFLLLGVGFCGAFTTFSTFAVETVRLAETGAGRRAVWNALVHLVGAVAAVTVGSTLASLVA